MCTAQRADWLEIKWDAKRRLKNLYYEGHQWHQRRQEHSYASHWQWGRSDHSCSEKNVSQMATRYMSTEPSRKHGSVLVEDTHHKIRVANVKTDMVCLISSSIWMVPNREWMKFSLDQRGVFCQQAKCFFSILPSSTEFDIGTTHVLLLHFQIWTKHSDSVSLCCRDESWRWARISLSCNNHARFCLLLGHLSKSSIS